MDKQVVIEKKKEKISFEGYLFYGFLIFATTVWPIGGAIWLLTVSNQ